jgi:hypothetical protein
MPWRQVYELVSQAIYATLKRYLKKKKSRKPWMFFILFTKLDQLKIGTLRSLGTDCRK